MKQPKGKKPHAEIRQSQVLTTFGPGSLLDLPHHSVLVSGLDHWFGAGQEVREPRLVDKLRRQMQLPSLRLFTPPPVAQSPDEPKTGIVGWRFPEWFIAQDVEEAGAASGRSRLLVHRTLLTDGKYLIVEKKKRPVVPVRFVRACRRGHIGDIDWYAFAHHGQTSCRRTLRIDERGTSGDLTEVWVRCDCGAARPLSQAAALADKALGDCGGTRPWLGVSSTEVCGEPSRLLVRTATNAYFPQILSVISLPERDEELSRAVDRVWEHHLQYVETLDDLQRDRTRKPPVKAALEGFTDEQVMAELEARRRGDLFRAETSVKQAEIEVLTASRESIGEDRPDGDFFARALSDRMWESELTDGMERLVLVHRLREVVAQVGFTRFEALSPDVEGELDFGVRRAALARDITWLPAIENRGEGIFIQFKSSAIGQWVRRPEVESRGRRLLEGFKAWKSDHHESKREFFGLPFLLLHSLSHLLITSMALECGYPASSIRERIYALPSGHGILLYTASVDAEGTLGGLVQVGRRIQRLLECALEMGRLCSNDPVCAQHDPADPNERRFLSGAACHGCLLIAETSCEQHNDFLDRALVVPTLAGAGAEFFSL